jgi:heme-degrading monooxygenase HmoA
MKNLIYLAAIASAILLTPASVKAQGFPYGGSSSTTIYAPSIETTTTTERLAPTIISPNPNSFGTSTITTYPGGSYPVRRRQYSQPTVILQQQNIYYPQALQSSCSTSIIGSPIPSPIALDRSGQPCR